MATAFDKLDAQIRATEELLDDAHNQLAYTYESQQTYNQWFSAIALGVGAVFLLVIAQLFDWLITLNAVLARIDLWIFVATIAVVMSQIFVRLVFAQNRDLEIAQNRYNHVRRQLRALKNYESGAIDEDGIHAFYTQLAQFRTHTIDVVLGQWVGYVVYILLSVGIIVFALIFA